jgi:hypothetical protein
MQTLGLSALSGQAELDLLRALETQKNRIPTVEHRLIADVDARGTAREHGCAGRFLQGSAREMGLRLWSSPFAHWLILEL